MEKNNNDIRIVNLSVEDLTPQNIGSYMNNNNKWEDYGINNDTANKKTAKLRR